MTVTSLKRSRIATASLSIVLFALLLVVSIPMPAQADQPDVPQTRILTASSDDLPPVREVIVKFKSDVRAVSAQLHRNLRGDVVRHSEAGRFDVVRVPQGRAVDDVIQEYMASGLVEYAEPNYPRSGTWEPNDQLYPLQWHFDHVNAEAAWDIRQGGSSVIVVAVLDSGVAYENNTPYALAPDLAGTVFVPGYDFVNSDDHPNDDHWHGTHVTGTIAQTTNNGLGVAGLAFGVSIMPVKVLGDDGKGVVADVVDGIYYAVDHGANVINMSLGGDGRNQAEADALAYAYEHGVVVVCSAGNKYVEGNPIQYPAAYESAIAVGATGYDKTRASYSNTGTYIDIVAPGGDGSYSVLQQTFSGAYNNFGFYYAQGTSMAAPHVSAAAALLLSLNAALTPDEIRFILESTAFDLGPDGWDEEYGHGLLDVAAALSLVVSVATPEVVTNLADGVQEQEATLHGVVLYDGGEGCDYSFQYGTVRGALDQQTGWVEGELGSGDPFDAELSGLQKGATYYFRARARNSAGIGYGEELSFTTLPDAPPSFTATPDEHMPFYRINLEWTSGAGASDTFIVAKVGAYPGDYPEDREDGVVVYDGPGESFVHSGLDDGTTYHYRAWSRVEDHLGEYVWSTDSVTATATTEVEPDLDYFSITLQPGWNMVSVPLKMRNMSIDSVFAGSVAVYTWNPGSKSYTTPDYVTPEKAYWVAVTSLTPLNWTGVPVSAWYSPITTGWNMIGSVYSGGDPVAVSSLGEAPQGSILRNAIYHWNPISKSYESSMSIVSGIGYWLATTLDCNLTMPAP
jgi:serine protease